MDLEKTLKELRNERSQIDLAIAAMERLGLDGRRKRRGRPPKWLVEAGKAEDKRSDPRK
jgi:hypothetical protein